MVRALEAIGAAVESERPGEAFFAVDGLRGIHGGDSAGVLAAARAARGARSRARADAGPDRHRADPLRRLRRAPGSGSSVPRGRLHVFLAPLSVAILPLRLDAPGREAEELVVTLERLGIETLQALSRISARPGRRPLRPARPAGAAASPAARTSRCARARRTRSWPSRSSCRRGPPGSQLDRALELLVDRLLAAPQRRGRTLLGLRLGALLSAGGSWSVEQGLGRPTASAADPALGCWCRGWRRCRGRRRRCGCGRSASGPPAADQLELAVGGEEPRRRRLGAAVREVRAAQGAEALLKILPVDSASRVPERWALLTPFPEL